MESRSILADMVRHRLVCMTESRFEAISFNEISDQLMAIARISKAHSEKLRAVVLQYGASKLSDVSPEHYEAILNAAEEIKNAG